MKDFNFPFMIDKLNNKPSVTLLFAYFAFILATISCGYLLYRDAIAGTVSSLMLFFGTLLFYRMRMVDKFSFDIENKKFEVEATKESEK